MNTATTTTKDLFQLLSAGRPAAEAQARPSVRPRRATSSSLGKKAGRIAVWMLLAACAGAAIANWARQNQGQSLYPIQRPLAHAKPGPAPEAVQRPVMPLEAAAEQAGAEGIELQETQIPMQAEVQAQSQPKGQPQSQPQSQPGRAPAIGPLVAQVAAKAGVHACAARIDTLSQFIAANSDTGAYFFVPPSDPNQRLVSFSYEVQPADARLPTAYASASFAPNQANGCGAIYEAIVYWPKNCKNIAKTQFAQFRPGRSVQKNVLVLENETPTRVFLMPAGTGCVSVKKELVL